MIPSFLKPTEAQKILLIGKSINFLREVCHQVRGFYKKAIVFGIKHFRVCSKTF